MDKDYYNMKGKTTMDKDEYYMKGKITKILIELGIPINLQGFGYFRECIFMTYRQPNTLKRVTKVLYPKVGEMFDVNGSVVERCMRHASEVAYCKTKFKCINCLYGLSDNENLNYKPTSSEIIALIAEYLRMEFDEVSAY